MNFISKLFSRKKNEPETAPNKPATILKEQPETQEQDEPKYITLKKAFKEKYPGNINILTMFESANLCPATWENITKVRLQKFIDYMDERLSPNSVHQYATKLKAVLNLYSDEVLLPRGFAKVLTPKKCASTAVYLTEEDIDKLIVYTPRNQREEYVRDMFVISCYTGARHSDAIRFTESNIVGDNLQYVSQKTKIHAVVPLKPIVREYIATCPKIEIDDTTYNSIIRRIAKRCGITEKVKVFKAGEEREGEKWEFLSSHGGRRTFATLLYLRGVDLYTISKMMGHSSTKMTENYIQADIKTDSAELMGYFK